MKNVGVVSYNIHCNFTNYGSALQSWALKQAIIKYTNGAFRPVLIDYCPDILADKNPLDPMKNMWDKDSESRKMCELSLPAIKVNYKKFEDFYTNQFNRTKKVYTSKNFDEVVDDEKLCGFICGSDTIFCVDEFGLDDGYYANYDCMKNGYTFSYAASFGDSHFDKETYKKLDSNLKNFKAIGIRENGMVDYIKERVSVPVQRVIDPTLLLTSEDYEPIVAKKQEQEKYLLLYARRYNKKMEEYAEKLAKDNGWKIVEISLRATNVSKHRMFYEAGVEEFLSLVKNSEYVVTNSYHAMIFAMQFKKEFVIFSREQCDTKILELASYLGVDDRILVDGNKFFKKNIDYKKVYKILADYREESLKFLLSGLEGIEKNSYLTYFETLNKKKCFGCEACAQVCPNNAITMVEDEEGFRYPKIDKKKCINCGMCRKICPNSKKIDYSNEVKKAFGGYHKDVSVRAKSTSGGAFSAIVDAYCDDNYVIFGAVSDGLNVYHSYIDDKNDLDIFRRSKYSQSRIGNSYKEVKQFLKDGKKVVFSGTPCQIAGLNSFLRNVDTSKLLKIEVVCEGVPSPIYINKFNNYIKRKYGSSIKSIDYRFKNMKVGKKRYHGKWDFEDMKLVLFNDKVIVKDRWFNPFWNIWLRHLMSRPSCYVCPFTTCDRGADITLGDLWGVHLYCPDLYGHNGGSSLIVCNTIKGEEVLKMSEKLLYGRYLDINDAIKYQSPMRKSIDYNSDRNAFMSDLMDVNTSYNDIVNKWYKKPTIKLLFSKYVWGNRQKVYFWNLKSKVKKNERND